MPSKPGRSRPAAEPSPQSSWRGWPGRRTFFTALGADELGRRSRAELTRLGVEVKAIPDAEPTRRAVTFVDDTGERTIAVLSQKLVPRGGDSRLPWHELRDVDGVFFVSGDAEALRLCRAAPVLVATSRELATLKEAGVQLDALVGSGEDEAEVYHPGDLEPAPHVAVTTAGGLGGWLQPGGPFRSTPLPGPGRRHLRRGRLLRRRADLRPGPGRLDRGGRRASLPAAAPP